MNSYIKFAPFGSSLSSSRSARAEKALDKANIRITHGKIDACKQASASVVHVPFTGITVLVSYETPVALKDSLDGRVIAVTKGFYSRTTDRAVSSFTAGSIVSYVSEAEFLKALRSR